LSSGGGSHDAGFLVFSVCICIFLFLCSQSTFGSYFKSGFFLT